jgi:hypothetical protein
MAMMPSVGLWLRSALPVLAVAALALGARPLRAQTPGPDAGPGATIFDEATFLSDLDATLERAAAGPEASQRSLHQAGERLLGERIGAWRRDPLRASGSAEGGIDMAKVRRLLVEQSRIEQRLRSLVSRRVDNRAARLASPLPPQPDARGLAVAVRDPGFVTSATGSISGTVTGPSAVSGWVFLYDAAGNYLAYVSILSGGGWSVTGLATGTYYAKTTNASGLVDKAWSNQACPFYNPNPKTECAATAISVTDGVTTPGIDFALVAGGRISGMVTASATSAPIPSVLVWVLDSQGRNRAYSYTNASGPNLGLYTSYQGLPTGTYYLKTDNGSPSPGFLDEGYDNMPCEPSCAVSALTPVTVTSPATTAGIDFALDAGGGVSGTVTDQDTGLPVAGVYAELYTDAGVYAGPGYTAADGTYTVGGLSPGTYKARTFNSSAYVDEVYDNQSCVSGDCDLAAGDPIIVAVGATTSGIDFALARGGSISGRVTRSDTSAGLPGVGVAVWVDWGTYANSIKTTTTDATGNYTFSGLAPASYLLSTAAAGGGQNFADEIYDDVPCVGCSVYYLPYNVDYKRGSPVVVASDSTTSGINFALTPGGQISGTLTRAVTGTPLSGSVGIYSRSGGGYVASAFASGAYVVNGLPTGQYAVHAQGYDGEIPEWYDNEASQLYATPVDVTAGALTPGIHFVLSLGGRVAGTVTRVDTGQPLRGASVYVHDGAGTQSSVATTNASGQYVSQSGLPTGKYTVLASAPNGSADLASRLYKAIDCLASYPYSADCAPGSGDAVPVTSPNTTSGIDFALPVGGAISGTVTDAGTGVVIPWLSVSASVANAAGGQTIRTTNTTTDGTFTMTALPPGGYYLVVHGGETAYLDQLYNNVACTACDVRLGQRVDVRAGATRTGVNFALTRGGAIGGRVTSATTGLGLRAAVWAYTATGQSVKSVTAAPNGNYTLSGLAPGAYRVLSVAHGDGHVDQIYSGIPCPNQNCTIPGGMPVSVSAGVTTGGIHFVLAASGSITGFVRDAAGHGVWGGYVYGFDGGFSWVQSDGYYRLTGLAPGGQYVATSAGDLVGEVYDNVPCFGCDPAASGATAVNVVAGAVTSGIDFTLDAGASIGGTVTYAGQPLGGATLRFLRSGGRYQYTMGSTRNDGTYQWPGFPPGTYYAIATKDGFDSQLYDGLACPGACDLTTGTPITVSGVAPVTGINFSLPTQSLDFYTVPPCRVLDTRNAVGGLGGPALSCQGDRNFPVAGTCGVPFDAKALSVNITATESTGNGHLRLHAGRTAVPTASSLNYMSGLTRANNAIVPLGTIGEIGIYCGQASGTTHAIVDVNGYFK